MPNAPSPGRLPLGQPVAVVDIGSNSVRLVVYEGLSRAPTPMFNEKALCGLGRGIATTGLLPRDGVEKALAAIRRFRLLCDAMQVGLIRAVATAAARDARNGPDFLAAVERALGVAPELLSGDREAELSALGVVCGVHDPDGIVADFGGGSLELVDVGRIGIGRRTSHRLGGIALLEASGESVKKAQKITRDMLSACPVLNEVRGRTVYAVGGTFRALARLHVRQRGYPLNVMHGYTIPARDAVEFLRLVERINADNLDSINVVNIGRRPLLAYGAVVLDEIMRRGKPKDIVISATGVREGLIYEMLGKAEREGDPLIVAARDLNRLRARAPAHAAELIAWTDAFFATLPFDETEGEKRLRHAACLLSDIGWRAHPDYRGEQTLNVIAHAAFVGLDHPGRAYLALTAFYRYAGLSEEGPSPRLRELATTRQIDRARVLGAAFRVAYLLSAAMPGVLGRTAVSLHAGRLTLRLPADLADLAGERILSRLKSLARLMGAIPQVDVR
jgi:exopolyphosphatase/guanosine-5'-triphosphate,3'-diphosphate pyrophosphatase